MKLHQWSAALLFLCLVQTRAGFADAAIAAPATDPPAPEARIAFANHGGIWNWQVIDDQTVLIQAKNRQWYKATLLGPCTDLVMADRLGFEWNADGSFDKFGAVQVRDRRCPLVSLVKTSAPAKKKARQPSAAASDAPPPELATPTPATKLVTKP